MSFYKEVPGRKKTLESTLKFDTEPKAGSTNPVTSDGIAAGITEAVGGASDALQEQIDEIAEKAGSGYTPKGEASVATLNGLTGQENGWLYTLTDDGTLTDGSIAVVAGDTVAWDEANSVWYKAMNYAPAQYGTDQVKNLPTTITSFRTGDVIPVDGPSGTAKMSKDDLLKETAQSTLEGNLAPAFDPTRDEEHKYIAGQLCVHDGSLYVFRTNHYGAWNNLHAVRVPLDSQGVITNFTQIIADSDQNLDDLNNALDNRIYVVQRTAETQTLNFPTEYATGFAILQTYNTNISNFGQQKLQVLHKLSTGEVWYRSNARSTWSAWTYVSKDASLPTNIAYVAPKQIFANWNQNLDDLNNAEDNRTYIIQRTAETQTLNLPNEYKSGIAVLQTYIAAYLSGTQKFQLLRKLSNGDFWYRNFGAVGSQTWSTWTYVQSEGSSSSGFVEIGPGKTYTTLRAGIDAAFAIKNCRVEVYQGTYDLEVEFADSISSTMPSTGLRIGNGMYIHFHQGAKVIAEFDENDYDAATWRRIYDNFEPFKLGGGDFTLEGLDISAKDTRYCVHDESSTSQNPYTHKYINCVMQYENTHTTDINYVQCIGGGLGKLGYIFIDGGRYKSITAGGYESVYGDASLSQRPISYHNSAAEDCESSIYIRNVYLEDKGYIQIIDYGTSTKVTKVQIDSCSYDYPPQHSKVRYSGAPDNMEVIEWSNNKRTNKHWVVESDDYHVRLVDD